MKTNWLYEDFEVELCQALEADIKHLFEQAKWERELLCFLDITEEAEELAAFLPTLQEHMAFGFRKFRTLSGPYFDLEVANATYVDSPFSYLMSTHELDYPRMWLLDQLYQHLNLVHFWPVHQRNEWNPPFEGADFWGMSLKDMVFTRPEEMEFTAFNPCVILQVLSNTLLQHADAGGIWSGHADPEALPWVSVAASLLQVVAPGTPVFAPLRVCSHRRFEFFFTQDRLFPAAYSRVSSLFVMDRKCKEITILAFADTRG